MSKFNGLIDQIELFIKKYYKNQIVKGLVLFMSVLLFMFLAISGLEYFGRFGHVFRLILFYLFFGVNVLIFGKYLVIPLFKLNKMSSRLSLNEAAVMIGSIFPDISDKLENTLQLNSQLSNSSQNLVLLNASIEQKASALSVIPFTTGINFKENRKYLRFLLPIVLILLLVGFFKPSILSDGSERIVNYNSSYVEPAPFQFELYSESEIVQGENYKLQIKLSGKDIPTEVKIISNLGTYNLAKQTNVLFFQDFSNVDKNITFICEANGFQSRMFIISVLQKPAIDKMVINLLYPRHAGLKNEILDNIGDVTVPEGTIIDWSLSGLNTIGVTAIFGDTSIVRNPNLVGDYKFKYQAFSSFQYELVLSSKDLINGDTLRHNITVVPDEFPQISMTDTEDSLNGFRHYIEGSITDDYGFKSLVAHIKITKDGASDKEMKFIKINPSSSKQFFYYEIDYGLFDLNPGDKLEYSFTVTDNDELNNFKSTTSARTIFTVPTLDSLDNLLSDNGDKLKEDINKSKADADKIRKEVKEIKNDLINKQSPDWKDKQNIENLLNMQENLQKQIDNIKNDFENNKKQEDEFLDNSEELKQKREELQKLIDELMDDEMKALMEELQKLMDEMNKDQLIQNLEQMESKTETMKEELDRTLELFKNMELDKKLESLEEQLKTLSEEQKALQKLTKEGKTPDEKLAKEQEEINKKFDEIQKDIQEAKDKNDQLEKPRDLNFDKELEDAIEKETSDSKENLDNGKTSKSEKNQEKASEMMDKMSDDVAAMQAAAAAQKDEEDMDAMRFLLENIINLSHQQENLMSDFSETRTTDPFYLGLNRRQLSLKNSTEIVNDSLIALSKRVFQLSGFINDELSDLNYSLNNASIHSEERKTSQLLQDQQYAMTAYNNLALMLSEVLDQMQQQQKSKMNGKGSCSKPGGEGSGSGASPQMSMQEMKDQMKKQIEKMKGGQQPGGKEGGDKPGEGGDGGIKPGGKKGSGIPGLSSKEVAKMAFEQGQMKKSLQKMRQDMNLDGSGAGNMLNDLINDIEDFENDLLNGNAGGDLYKRQQEIMTRLLESDKAIQERGFSEKRESNSANSVKEGNQIDIKEYNKRKNAEVELLKSIPVGLRVYYKNLVNEYFNSVNN